MSGSAFAFYRGAALILAADLAKSPNSGLTVQLCGDAHISNFGMYVSPERRLVFDINDFDETHPGPFSGTSNAWRAASRSPAGGTASPRRSDDASSWPLRGYRESMREFASAGHLAVWYSHLDMSDVQKQIGADLDASRAAKSRAMLDKARSRDSVQALAKLTTMVDGRARILSEPPLLVPIEELWGQEQASVRPWRRGFRRLVDRRREALGIVRLVPSGSYASATLPGMDAISDGVVTRRVLPVALARMVDDPVVLLEGPRSVGKSTLLRQISTAIGGRIVDLDDPGTREAVAADPATFVAGGEPVCIDEYQKAPIVLEAIKAELNRDSRPGRFVLTGSTRHEALPDSAQSLTGRLSRLTVSPLSQGELGGERETLLADLLSESPDLVGRKPTSATTRAQYIERIVAGGFPMALAKSSSAARNRWIDDYVELTLGRDIREVSRVRQAHLMAPLFHQLASQTAQVLNIEKASRDVGLDRPATYRYLDLLETVFLIYRLPGWGKNLRARATSAPRVHVLDSGVAARLLRLTPAKLASLDATSMTELGHLLETFAVGEIRKQASWLDDVGPLGHWRTSDGDEVDLVVERDDGAVVAFEVKAAGRVPGDEFRGLRKLRTALGTRFLAGVVLYLGPRSYTFEDRLHAMPMDRIWTP